MEEQKESGVSVNIDGPTGDSVFSKGLACSIDPSFMDNALKKVQELDGYIARWEDDRLFAIGGALLVENDIDEIAAAIMPKYKDLRDKSDFTFAMKIEVVRALRLLPSRILNSADCIRKIRNEFAHDLSVDTFEKLKPEFLQSLLDRASSYTPHAKPSHDDHRQHFKDLLFNTRLALVIYRSQVSWLNHLIRDTDTFMPVFEKYCSDHDAGPSSVKNYMMQRQAEEEH
ncbi:MAG: hypothetical protein KAJ81_04175 [Candidatus Latescibacteria bacterium]|nr:hypothetical protein [Candidatus Latescibacterota bacterium]